MSWRNAEKIEFLGGRRNNSGLQQERETHTLNKINDICDFSRGGLNTRLYTLVSKPCSEAANKDYFIPRGLCFGCLCKLRIYFEKDLTGCTPFIFRSSSAPQPHKSEFKVFFFLSQYRFLLQVLSMESQILS